MGVLDRALPEAVLQRARKTRGGDRRAGEPELLHRTHTRQCRRVTAAEYVEVRRGGGIFRPLDSPGAGGRTLMWSAFFQAADYQAIKPEILLTIFGLGILLLEFLVEKRDRYLNAVAALIGLGFATYQITWFW